MNLPRRPLLAQSGKSDTRIFRQQLFSLQTKYDLYQKLNIKLKLIHALLYANLLTMFFICSIAN